MSLTETYIYAVFWQRFRRNRFALAGGAVIIALFILSSLAPYLTPYEPGSLDLYHVLTPPSSAHWFGTDDLGRDVLTRVIYGARVSLKVGFIAVGIAMVIGT